MRMVLILWQYGPGGYTKSVDPGTDSAVRVVPPLQGGSMSGAMEET
jgi:hypothetical protein